MNAKYYYYKDIHGITHRYLMASDYDTPEKHENMSRIIDEKMHECSMYECKYIFSGCDRVYKKPIDKKDNRRCIEYKHKNL